MPDIQVIFTRQRKYIFFLLSIYVLGWGFTEYKTVFAGLILGTGISLYNMWLLARRTKKFGDAVVHGTKVRSLGFLSRLAAAVLAIMIAMEYPGHVHLISVVLGLMTSYFVIMIDFIIQSLHLRR
ncbi:ATP synthase subunit I [Mesobacillus foraminis]|jgi:ATP synthase protein I|uniref:ATP synthase protein I n=1 Tax=Mesobacillus foraminis TaxID=279826 RepID=A0A4R2BDY2_9BACI|nr:ATP synthase subunit I [Mesobacillus foraminis]TCN24059.1 ATP synthase protein I [Mesobacillus foraminis]